MMRREPFISTSCNGGISLGRNAPVYEKEPFAPANGFSIYVLELEVWRYSPPLVPVKVEIVHVNLPLDHVESLALHVNSNSVHVNVAETPYNASPPSSPKKDPKRISASGLPISLFLLRLPFVRNDCVIAQFVDA